MSWFDVSKLENYQLRNVVFIIYAILVPQIYIFKVFFVNEK